MQVTAPDDVYVSALERQVRRGESIEVPPEIGESLVAQGWKSARQVAAKKAAAARKAEAKDDYEKAPPEGDAA